MNCTLLAQEIAAEIIKQSGLNATTYQAIAVIVVVFVNLASNIYGHFQHSETHEVVQHVKAKVENPPPCPSCSSKESPRKCSNCSCLDCLPGLKKEEPKDVSTHSS